jgi:hypothetical protein
MKETENGTITETSATSVLIQLIGIEAVRKISATFGGEILYVPKRIREGRDDIIREEFSELLESGSTCMNAYKNLAEKNDLSTRRIMAIVKG